MLASKHHAMSRLGARGSKPSAGASRAQREAGVRGRQPPTTEPSSSGEKPSAAVSGGTARVQRSTASAATTRSASQGLRACICFQRSAYTARSATQRAALHSAQRYTVRSATQCAAMHSAQRFTAPSATQRPALHCAQRFTAPSASSAQHCTAPPTPSPALHSAQHYTAPSATLHPALHRAACSTVRKVGV